MHSGKGGRGFQETCGSVPSFLILGQLIYSRGFHFYARVALSGRLLGWFRDYCGMLSSIQCVVPSHDELGISSSTASQLLISTGRTRKFEYYS